MSNIEDIIREKALSRIAKIFNVPVDSINNDCRFGEELKSSFVSDFRHNEFDQINHDIHDVSDRSISKELRTGHLVIRTVADYCAHMVRCYKSKPNDVKKILGIV